LLALLQEGGATVVEHGDGLTRERHVLCTWHQAIAVDTLELPQDSPLKIPSLYDDAIVPTTREAQEAAPTVLVLEDLTAAGFTPRDYITILTAGDLNVVVDALADLHVALWHIRDRLSIAEDVAPDFGPEKMAQAKSIMAELITNAFDMLWISRTTRRFGQGIVRSSTSSPRQRTT
jgi:hypothetical protein